VSCSSVTITQHVVGTGVTKCQIVYTAQQSAMILAFLSLSGHFLFLVWQKSQESRAKTNHFAENTTEVSRKEAKPIISINVNLFVNFFAIFVTL
jgi:hypothetical protein